MRNSQVAEQSIWLGVALTAVLILLVLIGGESISGLAWLALLPALAGWFIHRQAQLRGKIDEQEAQLARQATELSAQRAQLTTQEAALAAQAEAALLAKAESPPAAEQANHAMLQQQVESLLALRDVTLSMIANLNPNTLLDDAIEVITGLLRFDRATIFLVDEERQALTFGAISHPMSSPGDQLRLTQLEIPLNAADFPLLSSWLSGRAMLVTDGEGLYDHPYGWIFGLLEMDQFLSIPLLAGSNLRGVLLADKHFTSEPITDEARGLLEALAANIAIALENARLHRLTDEQLNRHVQQLNLVRQIDRELNDALSWDRVLQMTLDWGLRITGANAASLAMVDHEAEELRIVATYGTDAPEIEFKQFAYTFDQGTMGRTAKEGKVVFADDITTDLSHVPLSAYSQAALSIPVRRHRSVIAVLTLESHQRGAFTTKHSELAEQLASRASVAIDNARLFEVTQREHEKLSSILQQTTNAVIVVGFDQRVVLLNNAAISIMRLDPQQDYTGLTFGEVFDFTPLRDFGPRLFSRDQNLPPLAEEIELGDERFFHIHLAPNRQVGWVIVMHDVTPFKETERLKNELLATVSHDLKNPLSVINGYVELLAMAEDLSDRGLEFVEMVRRSIVNMRQLIDDLLDMAFIDAGLDLKLEPVAMATLVDDVVHNLKQLAEEKMQSVVIELPETMPEINGDDRRLQQVMTNLVSNAIKYTPPEGNIRVQVEAREDTILVSVKDNGLGISPENQAQIFERFFRVRRPETDGIEGTGLGLAIVKSLVEAHGGEMGLTSQLGEGSTFYFTLPLSGTPADDAEAEPAGENDDASAASAAPAAAGSAD